MADRLQQSILIIDNMFKNAFKKVGQTYKAHFTKRAYLWALFSGSVMLIAALYVNFYASIYATTSASNSVTDIILSNVRVYDVDTLFIYGTLIFWYFFSFLCFIYPQRVPYLFKSISLFVLIRAVFISLTHIAPFATTVVITPVAIVNKFTFGADLFFSGHTGLPFLLALIFWKHKTLRVFFLFSSVFFAIVVLLGHIHYSIDVFAAFFITYTIHKLTTVLFKKDITFFDYDIGRLESIEVQDK